MRLKFFTLFLFFVSGVQAQKIKSDETKNFIGKNVTVCDKVFGVYQYLEGKGQPTFINLGAKHPQSKFIGLVWDIDREKFPYQLEILENKNVCITGVVKLAKLKRSKPEIIITSPSQIQIQK